MDGKTGGMIGLINRTVISTALLCALSGVYGFAGAPEEVYNKGNQLYAEKQYEAAVELYDSIDIINPDVEYNRAAAYFKIGKVGKAALHFNRSLRLRPDDADTIYNLNYINTYNSGADKNKERGVISDAVAFLVDSLPLETMSLISAMLYLITALAGLGVIMSLDPKRKQFLARSLLPLLVVTTLWFTATGIRVHQLERIDRAIAIDSNVDVYDSPSDKTRTVFSMNEGTEVNLGRVEGNYIHVTLVSGYSGWVVRGKLERI
jgi:tetratricopeptide (TPR) repeat protein